MAMAREHAPPVVGNLLLHQNGGKESSGIIYDSEMDSDFPILGAGEYFAVMLK